MQKSINQVKSYHKLSELITLHHTMKNEAMAQVKIFKFIQRMKFFFYTKLFYDVVV